MVISSSSLTQNLGYLSGGRSDYTLGDKTFKTRQLTLEFKNNIDGLIENITDSSSPKSFTHMDMCVCWSKFSKDFKGFDLEEITEENLDSRKFPGVTHLLRSEKDSHTIQVIMLKKVLEMIERGDIILPSLQVKETED